MFKSQVKGRDINTAEFCRSFSSKKRRYSFHVSILQSSVDQFWELDRNTMEYSFAMLCGWLTGATCQVYRYIYVYICIYTYICNIYIYICPITTGQLRSIPPVVFPWVELADSWALQEGKDEWSVNVWNTCPFWTFQASFFHERKDFLKSVVLVCVIIYIRMIYLVSKAISWSVFFDNFRIKKGGRKSASAFSFGSKAGLFLWSSQLAASSEAVSKGASWSCGHVWWSQWSCEVLRHVLPPGDA